MKDIQLLDCTLRDGGCVNNFNFGNEYMHEILNGIEQSNVEIIECGYIDEKNGSLSGRTQFLNEQVIPEVLIKDKKQGKKYVAMIDYGKFDVHNLKKRTENSIDGIRLAFHKKDCNNMIEWGKVIMDKGYELFIQPMLVLRYSDKELINLIEKVNEELGEAYAFYIVDSFGEMRENDLNRVANLVDHNLAPQISIGFHSHNNLQLSYSNSIALLSILTERRTIFDVSILGMGKGAGNLNAEIFAEHLNIYYGKHYQITPMLYVIDNVLNQIKEDFYWGYSIEYYLSAINHCTPSYAGYFYSKHTMTVEQVAKLLSLIDDEKKISFDKEYAKELYYNYNANYYDDKSTVEELKNKFSNRNVMVIAPGMSIVENMSVIQQQIKDNDCIVIALNHSKYDKSDFVFATKYSVWEKLKNIDVVKIVTSNICIEPNNSTFCINYEKYNAFNGEKRDISLILCINLLMNLNVSSIFLAGCDGFKTDMDSNYYDETLRRPVTKAIANERNMLISNFINYAKSKLKIKFVTKSLYDTEK